MATDNAPHGANTANNEGTDQQQDRTPQGGDDTDWKAEARKWESRAKENLAKAKQHEDAARRLAELEERDKTETQKLQDKLAAAEKRAKDAEAALLRHQVAAEKNVPADLLTGGSREELEAAADKLIAFRGDNDQQGKQEEQQKRRLEIPDEGKQANAAGGGSTAELFAEAVEDLL